MALILSIPLSLPWNPNLNFHLPTGPECSDFISSACPKLSSTLFSTDLHWIAPPSIQRQKLAMLSTPLVFSRPPPLTSLPINHQVCGFYLLTSPQVLCPSPTPGHHQITLLHPHQLQYPLVSCSVQHTFQSLLYKPAQEPSKCKSDINLLRSVQQPPNTLAFPHPPF